MASSDSNAGNQASRPRKRSNSLVWLLALGIVVFTCAGVTLYYVLQPATLRIAVGPPGSDDYKVIEAMAETFAGEGRTVRLSPITTQGAAEAIALLAVEPQQVVH